MSLRIDWDRLDNAAAKNFTDTLQAYFDEAQMPDWLTSLQISHFEWGKDAPEVEIVDIADVFPVFRDYQRPYEDEYYIEHSSSPLRYVNPYSSYPGSVASSGKHTADPEEEHPVQEVASATALPKSNPFHVQFVVSLSYTGNMVIGLDAQFSLNYPAPLFLSLPISLKITHIEVTATCVVAFVGSYIHVTLLKEGDLRKGVPATSPKLNLKTEWEVGDPEQQVLRNAAKIDKFIHDLMHTFLADKLIYPNFHTTELTHEDEDFHGVD